MNKSKTINRKSNITWLAFTLVMLVAFFFRFYRLADLPLGVFFDPAINGLDTLRLLQRGGWVIFFPTNGGREALFMYLLIPFIQFFGTIPLALRFPTAAASLLTVALLFGLLKSGGELYETNRSKPLWLATLGGLILATLYWHIFTSRLGQRPILVPLVAVLIYWFFLLGWTTGRKKWFIFSGLCMGLAGYTYPAARMLPVILALALLPEFFFLRKNKAALKQTALNLCLFLLAALVIYLPMAWYLLTHPAQFTARAGSVMVWNFLSTPADIAAELGRNLLRVVGFFGYAGSLNPIFGLPAQPGLHPLLTPFLLIGLVIALKNWRNLFYRLVALWWLVGIAPSIFAIEAPHPLRMIAAVAPTAILAAFGLEWGAYYLSRIALHSARSSFFARLAAVLLILATMPATFHAYFIEWPHMPVTQGIYDYNAVALRDAVLEQAKNDLPLYLPFSRFNDSTLLYYLGGSFKRQAAFTAPPADSALVISPEKALTNTTWVRLHRGVATLLPPLTTAGQQLIQTALSADSSRPIYAVTGETAARLAVLPADPVRWVQQPTRPITATFGPARLTGVSYPFIIDPSATQIPITLFWQAAAPMAEEYEVVLHLVNDQRQVLGNGSGRPADWVYPTTFWQPSLDNIAAQHQVSLEHPPLPPGRYWLAVAFFDPSTGRRLPLTQGAADSPDTLFIGPLKAPLPPSPAAPPLNQEATFGDVARLVGFDPGQLVVTPGEPLELKLWWQSLTPTDRDYTVFIHLLNANDTIAAGYDSQPLDGRYPTSIWTPGERIPDLHRLPTPNTLPPGQYQLAVGLYYQPTGERLPLRQAGQIDPNGRLILPALVVVRSQP